MQGEGIIRMEKEHELLFYSLVVLVNLLLPFSMIVFLYVASKCAGKRKEQVHALDPMRFRDSEHIPPAGWNPNPPAPLIPLSENPPTRARAEAIPPEENQSPALPNATLKHRGNAIRNPAPPSESASDHLPAPEGSRKVKTNYAVVRSARLRKAAIQIHGRDCCVCGFNFDEEFGESLAQGYIEIHHLNNIASGTRHTNPVTDLAPLCSNCHAMADRLTRSHPSPPRSIPDLKSLLRLPPPRQPPSKPSPNETSEVQPELPLRIARKRAPRKNS